MFPRWKIESQVFDSISIPNSLTFRSGLAEGVGGGERSIGGLNSLLPGLRTRPGQSDGA